MLPARVLAEFDRDLRSKESNAQQMDNVQRDAHALSPSKQRPSSPSRCNQTFLSCSNDLFIYFVMLCFCCCLLCTVDKTIPAGAPSSSAASVRRSRSSLATHVPGPVMSPAPNRSRRSSISGAGGGNHSISGQHPSGSFNSTANSFRESSFSNDPRIAASVSRQRRQSVGSLSHRSGSGPVGSHQQHGKMNSSRQQGRETAAGLGHHHQHHDASLSASLSLSQSTLRGHDSSIIRPSPSRRAYQKKKYQAKQIQNANEK